jgi:hypothetical protein
MDKEIGEVTHYYNRLGVAVIKLSGELNVGDEIVILGHTTDLQQQVSSLEVDRKKIMSAAPGTEVAMLVGERVRGGDKVYKVIES